MQEHVQLFSKDCVCYLIGSKQYTKSTDINLQGSFLSPKAITL